MLVCSFCKAGEIDDDGYVHPHTHADNCPVNRSVDTQKAAHGHKFVIPVEWLDYAYKDAMKRVVIKLRCECGEEVAR